MQEDYASAASRHYADASRLLSARRYDNAAYLAGYVAECGIKAVAKLAGQPLWGHLSDISDERLMLVGDLSFAARRYPLDLNPSILAIREKWGTKLRYVPTGTLSEKKAGELIYLAQTVLLQTVGALVLDGFLERPPA